MQIFACFATIYKYLQTCVNICPFAYKYLQIFAKTIDALHLQRVDHGHGYKFGPQARPLGPAIDKFQTVATLQRNGPLTIWLPFKGVAALEEVKSDAWDVGCRVCLASGGLEAVRGTTWVTPPQPQPGSHNGVLVQGAAQYPAVDP